MAKSAYQIKDFQGAVVLIDWCHGSDSQLHKMFVGSITVMSALEATGLELTNRESNWIVRVEGAKSSITFPGCKVAAIIDWDVKNIDVNRDDIHLVP